VTATALDWDDGQATTLACVHPDRKRDLAAAGLVIVGQRRPVDDLYTALQYDTDGHHAELPFALTRIGDCEAPSIVAAATYAGHRYAQELGDKIDIDCRCNMTGSMSVSCRRHACDRRRNDRGTQHSRHSRRAGRRLREMEGAF
jgi:hypothetical protein